MMKQSGRILAFCLTLLTVFTLLFPLTGCNQNNRTGQKDGGDRIGDGWEGVDFGGDTVRMCVSAHQDIEVTFPAADIYTKGPDGNNVTDKVQMKAKERNEKVAKMLNVNVEYTTMNLNYDEIVDNVKQLVTNDSEKAPDIYNNDEYGLIRAMVGGYLWNVKNAGEGIRNYFDFTDDGWYTSFMEGCTVDPEKLYVLSGDYFIDMVRMAWVLYINETMFNSNLNKIAAYNTISDFYTAVDCGAWDYDLLEELTTAVKSDVNRDGVISEKDKGGLFYSHITGWIFTSSTGNTVLQQDKDGKPFVITDTGLAYSTYKKLRSLFDCEGTVYRQEVLDSTKYFMDGNFLFAMSVLGEMESAEMRNISFDKGLVPIPKFDSQKQDDYHTMVHDQTEMGCILKTTRSFPAASAVMQALNEESADTLREYYAPSLKVKYNDNPNARKMIDLVHETIDNGFGMTISGLIFGDFSADIKTPSPQTDVGDMFSSIYAANYEAYEEALQAMLDKFAAMP
ncbi:MAG: hypothetical protein MJ078_00720 [Clostridia bacterium]|nr:hypothetical protein [Clostridia bacterium]